MREAVFDTTYSIRNWGDHYGAYLLLRAAGSQWGYDSRMVRSLVKLLPHYLLAGGKHANQLRPDILE
jgi:hypothetical protein